VRRAPELDGRSRANDGGGGLRRRRPRVVIFDAGTSTRVEVVDLPEGATLGSSICHLGRCWRVVGERPRSRVLIAEPSD
jgi:hypothetical protein